MRRAGFLLAMFLATSAEMCSPDSCERNADCSEGQICQSLATWGGGQPVKICAPPGAQTLLISEMTKRANECKERGYHIPSGRTYTAKWRIAPDCDRYIKNDKCKHCGTDYVVNPDEDVWHEGDGCAEYLCSPRNSGGYRR